MQTAERTIRMSVISSPVSVRDDSGVRFLRLSVTDGAWDWSGCHWLDYHQWGQLAEILAPLVTREGD